MSTTHLAENAQALTPTTQELVNELFDTIKQQHGLVGDAALARHIGVHPMYVWRWRRGQFDTSTDILLPLITHYAAALQVAPAQIAA